MLLCKHINNYLYEQQKTCSSENEILCIDGVGSKEHVPSMDSSLHPGRCKSWTIVSSTLITTSFTNTQCVILPSYRVLSTIFFFCKTGSEHIVGICFLFLPFAT
jgi:hypothetical protein